MPKEERRGLGLYFAFLALLVLSPCLWSCAPVAVTESGLRGEGESPADFVRKPRFFGAKTAQNSIIIYTNPQCPPCKRLSEALLELFPRLDPEKTQVIVLGHGFFEQGTRLLYTAALLAQQNQAMAVAFLAEAMRSGAAPYVAGDGWLHDWLGRSGFAASFDEGAYLELAASEELRRTYAEGVFEVREAYGLTSTPSLIINGRLYSGERTVEGILCALDAR